MKRIRIGIVGVGNCASSLVQGIQYYRTQKPTEAIGLMHWDLGGYAPGDIEVVCAFDIDERKVGKDVSQAIFALPNCTVAFCSKMPKSGVKVRMGKVLDGVSEHLNEFDESKRFVVGKQKEPAPDEVISALKETGTEVLLNYLPVGSQKATEFYAQCALDAGVAFVNNMPVFIASDPRWAQKFREKNVPILGDDIKAQIGATITHRTLAELFKKRGVKLDRTYQLNTGGNSDFLNMLNRSRLSSKKTSKTQAVQSVLAQPLEADNIHIGPSDYVSWQKDNKVAFIRMEGRTFGGVPMNMELRLSVEDSPNSAGIAIDAIRCAKLALERKQGGIIEGPSAYFMKHPPRQMGDEEAFQQTEKFIHEKENRK
ncbi:MAG: inositol-3-phosphate synthase [Candidatus Diapherotrites archaeon]|nr:inositol-3-phosphate synthase [Candidatus Diapherotrites archaeon]